MRRRVDLAGATPGPIARATLERQCRAVLPQPAGVFTMWRPPPLEQLPEARRVVHDLEVADLVPDDVVENRGRRKQQPPVEAHRPVARTARPAGALRADRQARVTRAGRGARSLQASGDLGP